MQKNYAEYVKVLAGDFLSKKFFTKYPEKLWGLTTDNLSAKFAPRRIEIREERKPFHSGKGRFSGCIEGGCGKLSDNLKKRISDLGGDLYSNYKANRFVFSDTSKQKISQIKFSNTHTIDTENSVIISTLPIDKNSYLFGHKTKLYFRSIFLINLIIKGPDRFPEEYDWLYFDSESLPFHRVGMQTRFSKKNVPDGYEILCCEVAHDDQNLSDELLVQIQKETVSGLISLDFIKEDEIIDIYSFDAGPVYPGYYFGHENELSKINAKLGVCENFYFSGSLAEYAYSDLQVLTAKSIDLANELATINENKSSEILKNSSLLKPSTNFNFGSFNLGLDKEATVFLIAEIGLAHNGSVDNCKKLIEHAKNTGFNSAKIQTYSKGRISKKTRTSRYFEESLSQEEPLSKLFDRIIFSKDELFDIFNYAKDLGIELFSTPFDKASVDLLDEFNVSGYKISSMDLVNIPLLRYLSKKKKPIILSAGMSSFGDIELAINECLENGNNQIAVLHCISSYPCPLEFSNLGRINELSRTFGIISGLSDHTEETITPSLAVVAGAKIVEKHITLDKGMDGPDHIFSLTPPEMSEMVKLLRKTEKAIYYNAFRSSPAELNAKQNLRRSIYSASNINPGDVITEDTLSIKSPGDGIPVKYYDILIGKRAIQKIEADHPLKWSHFFNE